MVGMISGKAPGAFLRGDLLAVSRHKARVEKSALRTFWEINASGNASGSASGMQADCKRCASGNASGRKFRAKISPKFVQLRKFAFLATHLQHLSEPIFRWKRLQWRRSKSEPPLRHRGNCGSLTNHLLRAALRKLRQFARQDPVTTGR